MDLLFTAGLCLLMTVYVSGDRFPDTFYHDFTISNYSLLSSKGVFSDKQLQVSDNKWRPYNISIFAKHDTDADDARLQLFLIVDGHEDGTPFQFGYSSVKVSLRSRLVHPDYYLYGDFDVGFGKKLFTQDDRQMGPIKILSKDLILKNRKWYGERRDSILITTEFTCCLH